MEKQELIYKGIKELVLSEEVVYHIYDVTDIKINLPAKKIMKPCIAYLYTADEGTVDIDIVGVDIDMSGAQNGKKYKIFASGNNAVDVDELNVLENGGGGDGTLQDYVSQFKVMPALNPWPEDLPVPGMNGQVIVQYKGSNSENYKTGYFYKAIFDPISPQNNRWERIDVQKASTPEAIVMTNLEFESAYNNNTLPYGDIIITGYVPATYFHNYYIDDYDENETYSYSDYGIFDYNLYSEYYVSNYSNDSIRIKHYGNGIIDKQCKIIHNNIEYDAECRYYKDEIKYINIDYYGMYVSQEINHKITKGFYIYKMHVNTNIFPCNIFCNYNSYYDDDPEYNNPIDFFGQNINGQNYFNIGLSENVYNNICKANNDIKDFIIFRPNFLLQKTLKFEIGNNIVESGAFVVLTGYYKESSISGYSYFYPEEFIVKDNVFKYKSNIKITGTCFIGNVFDEYSHIIISIETWLTSNTEDGTFDSIFNYNIIGENTYIYKCRNTDYGISEFTYNKIGKLCIIGVGNDISWDEESQQYVNWGDGAFNCNEVGNFTVIGDYMNNDVCAALGNVSYNKIGSRCDIKKLRQGCYGNIIGDYVRNLYTGINFKNNSIGNDYVAENNTGSSTTWTIGNNVENCHIGNGCNSIRFGDNCGACSIGDNSSYIDMGGVTYSVHIGADCQSVSCGGDYCLNSTVADHARNLSIQNVNYVNFKENASGIWNRISYGEIGGNSSLSFMYNSMTVDISVENIFVDSNVSNIIIIPSSYGNNEVLKNITILSGDYKDGSDNPQNITVAVDSNKNTTIGMNSQGIIVAKNLFD